MKLRFATAIALLTTLAVAGVAPAQNALQPDASRGRELAENRERESAHGLSLRPPVDTRMVRRTADEYVMRLADTRGAFTMSLLIKRSDKPMTLKAVTQSVQAQVLGVEMNLRGVPGQGNRDFQLKGRTILSSSNKGAVIAQREAAIAGRPATVTYYEVYDNNNQPMLLAHAIIQLETQVFAVLDAEGRINPKDPGSGAAVADTFERVLTSIEVDDPQQLSKRREETVALGHKWRLESREPKGQKALHAALIPVQFFRFVETSTGSEPRDYGWMRVRQFTSKKGTHDKPGVNVEVQLRVQAGDSYFDTLGEYFLSDDDTLEMWSIRTTERPANPRVKVKDTLPTYQQTGVRSDGVLTIRLDDPVTGRKEQRFEVPKSGYLSQVEGLLLPQILPIAQRATYGFYFYNTQTGSVAYREEQIVPTLAGFSVISRLTPTAPQLTATYNKQRKVIEKQLDTSGSKLLPSDGPTIQRIWRTR